MILTGHSDASYLSKPNAQSRAGGHFILSNDTNIPKNNGAVLNIAHIIKHVMLSATEVELAGLYIMAREAVYIRIILDKMGHKQPPMHLLLQFPPCNNNWEELCHPGMTLLCPLHGNVTYFGLESSMIFDL